MQTDIFLSTVYTCSIFRPVMVICREVQNTNEKYIKVYTVGGITEFVYIKDHPRTGHERREVE
jgi:hypothetical protein